MSFNKNMVDVSNNQGVLSDQFFEYLVSKGIKTIAIKAGEWIDDPGGWHCWEDPQLANSWQLAAKYEITRIAYMYMHPQISATDQAQSLGNLVTKYGMRTTDRLMADVELPGFTIDYLIALLQGLDQAAGKSRGTSIFYSGYAYIEENLNGGVGLGEWPLYLADWYITNPPIPQGWTRVSYWQYGPENIDGKEIDADEVMPGTPTSPTITEADIPEEIKMAGKFEVVTGPGGNIESVFVEAANGHLLQYTPQPNGSWNCGDVTADSSGATSPMSVP
jgi:hypothetical protein